MVVSFALRLYRENADTYHSDSFLRSNGVMESNGIMNGDRGLTASCSFGSDSSHVIVGGLTIASGVVVSGLLVARSLTVSRNGRGGRRSDPHGVGDGRSGGDSGSGLLLGLVLSSSRDRDCAYFWGWSRRDGLFLRRALSCRRDSDKLHLGSWGNGDDLLFDGGFGL